MAIKYVIVETLAGCEVPILFSDLQEHKDFNGVVSAGFVSVGIGSDYCLTANAYGKSISLNLAARPQDSEILTKFLSPY